MFSPLLTFLHSTMAKGGGGKLAQTNEQSKLNKQAIQGLASAATALEKLMNGAETPKTSSKGGSKGKGKNKHDAAICLPCNLPTTKPSEGQWPCMYKTCAWAKAGKCNLSFRKRCGGCDVLKHEAMNPPMKHRIASQTAPSSSLRQKEAEERATASKAKAEAEYQKELKGKNVAARLDNEGKETANEEPLTLKQATAEALRKTADEMMEPPKKKPLLFDAAQKAAIAKILPALQPLQDSLQEEYIPTPLSLAAPEEVVDKFLGENRPCSRASEREAHAARVKDLQGAMTMLSEEDGKLLATKLASEQAALAKLDKEPTNLESQLAGLLEAASKFERGVKERLNRLEIAKAKTAERARARKQLLEELAEELQKAEETTEALQKTHEDAYAKRAAQHLEQETGVRAKLELKKMELEQKLQKEKEEAEKRAKKQAEEAAQSTTATGAERASQPTTGTGNDATTASAAEQELQRRLEANFQRQLQQAMDEMKSQLQQRDEALRHRNQLILDAKLREESFHRNNPSAVVDKLPVLSVPAGEQAVKQGQLYELLESWEAAGAATPLTFQDFIVNAHLAADAPLFMRTALGSNWELLFPNAGTQGPAPTDTIPKQAVQLLLASLRRLKQHWHEAEKAKDIAAEALTSFAKMTDASKKRRAQLFDIDMSA